MKEQKRNVFLGITKDGELAFGHIEARHPHYYSKEKGHYEDENRLDFSCSFDTCSIFNKTKYIESGEFERDVESYVEWDMDSDTKVSIMERFDCRPSDIPDLIMDDGVEMWIDNSTYPEEVIVNEQEYIFRAEAVGQHDLREEGMKYYSDERLFKRINEMWDKYHLKEISPEVADNLFAEIDESLEKGNLIDKYDYEKMQETLTMFIKELEKDSDLER